MVLLLALCFPLCLSPTLQADSLPSEPQGSHAASWLTQFTLNSVVWTAWAGWQVGPPVAPVVLRLCSLGDGLRQRLPSGSSRSCWEHGCVQVGTKQLYPCRQRGAGDDRLCHQGKEMLIVPCGVEELVEGQPWRLCSDLMSRLADFHANCRASYQTLTSCPTDNYQACLGSYAGMIGFDITPNYVDSSPTGIVVSPWCSCRGSGNMEEECEKFLKDFTENPCLRNAIQAFGNGTDVNLSPKSPPFQATQAPRVEKTPSLPDDLSDSTSLGTSVITTCTSVQEQGLKANNSKELSMCFTELTTNIIPGSKRVIKPNSGPRRVRPSAALTAASFLMLKLAL
ncbi:hypothetical protein FD755_015184 [Muntiacus reevesi]|uniref:GDNF family receptor alpha-2 n=1 Tax=Muntiacus reevesi TaxID=9886 RepID=A0A5N3XM33_MUNRE|nr:hypothetical protein FD755_015184 [Muntiacus reevesi]